MTKLFTQFLLAVALLVSLNSSAQDGANDPTFNPSDLGYGYGDGADYYINTTTLQSDGKIIIGGSFKIYNGTNRNYIARLNTDGSLDNTFNLGTGFNNSVNTTSIQSDGKIIVGGAFTSYNGTARNRIARLNSDGSTDSTFNPGTGFDNTVYTTAIQSDGKIVIGGGFTGYNGRNYITRLNTDGSLDNTFNPGPWLYNWVLTSAIQSDGKIIIGGFFASYNGLGKNYIARLNTDGSLDNTFNLGTGFNNTAYTTAIQSDGKIIIGGDFTSYNGTVRNRIARLNTDGSIDNTFNPGTGFDNLVWTNAIQSDGKIIVGGSFTGYNGTARNFIARLNTDGSLDNTFNPGTGFNSGVVTCAIQSDGKIIVGGNFLIYNGTARNRIARLNANGNLENTFNSGTGFNDDVFTTAIQGDGKIIIGGNFISYNDTALYQIARLKTDGSLDNTFNSGTGFSDAVFTTDIQGDEKIIVGGNFTSFNGTARNCIARLNADGSLDNTFNPGTGFNSGVYTTAIQSDGKIIVGGHFASYNGTARNYISRLNADGSLDNTFNPGTGCNGDVWTTAIQSDGKIIVGGSFSSYNGAARNNISRLNADGSLDNTFNPGTGFNSGVFTTAIQSDGKIIIGGSFSSYNGAARNKISRLNVDGSLDNTFNPGTGFNNTVWTNAIQSDGKIIIGGDFISYNGTSINSIARLNTDGSLDNGFDPGTGANRTIYTSAIQSDGKIIIGGIFTAYAGAGRNRIARINNTVSVTGITNYVQAVGLSVFPNPNKGDFTICLNKEETFSLINSLGQTVQTITLNNGNNNSSNVTGMESGIYFLVSKSNALVNYKVVVDR
jgi:uncharacterized delta-60 repeat protein